MTMVKMIANATEATLLAKLGIYMQGRDDGTFTLEYDDELGFTRVEAPVDVAPAPAECDCENCKTIAAGLQETSTDKIRVDLVPTELEYIVGTMLTAGVRAYDERAWERGRRWGNEYAAIRRHLGAWWGGETVDPDFGHSHLWHALTRLTMLATMEMRAIGADDRPWSSLADHPQPVTATGDNPDYELRPEPEPETTAPGRGERQAYVPHGGRTQQQQDVSAAIREAMIRAGDEVASRFEANGVGISSDRAQKEFPITSVRPRNFGTD